METTIHSFFSHYVLSAIRKNIILIDPFTRPSGVYYLEEGFVRQYSVSEDGKELTIHIYEPHSHFPMFWAFDLYENRHYFQAMTDIQVRVVPKNDVIEHLRTHPENALSFIKNLLLGIEGLSKRLEVNAFGSAHARVVSVILYLASHFGIESEGVLRISQPITHERIATISGLTREHVSVEIGKLQKEGLIRLEHHCIIILDPKRLSEKLPF